MPTTALGTQPQTSVHTSLYGRQPHLSIAITLGLPPKLSVHAYLHQIHPKVNGMHWVGP